MKQNLLFKVWLVLIMLTNCTALVSNSKSVLLLAIPAILVLSAVKFFLVSNYFMEMKRAHLFWKLSILFYLIVVIGTFLLILK